MIRVTIKQAFKDFLKIDWENILDVKSNHIEEMWLTFKNIPLKGTTKFVPIVKNFPKHLWNRPIPTDTHQRQNQRKK